MIIGEALLSPALKMAPPVRIFGMTRIRFTRGKYALPSLPAVYAGENEAETLELVLKDRDSELYVTLLYGVLPSRISLPAP